MTDAAAIQRAREDARRARLRVTDDVAILKQRLSPATLAEEAKSEARRKVATVVGDATALTKGKPALVAGGVAAAGLVLAVPKLRRLAISAASFLARNPKLVGRLFRRR